MSQERFLQKIPSSQYEAWEKSRKEKAESCRRIQRIRVRNIAFVVAHGIELEHSKEHILNKIDEQDDFWRDGLEMSECPTDSEVDEAVKHLKDLVNKLVV